MRVARQQALVRRARRAAGGPVVVETSGGDSAEAGGSGGQSPRPSQRLSAPEPDTPTRALLALLQEADAAGEPPLTSQALYEAAVGAWGGGGGGGGGASGGSDSPEAAATTPTTATPRDRGMFPSRRRFKAALRFLRDQDWVRSRPPPTRGGRGSFVLALTDEGRAQPVGAGEVPPSRFWREALWEVARREVEMMTMAGAGQEAGGGGGGGGSARTAEVA
jgi:hypothetical protein